MTNQQQIEEWLTSWRAMVDGALPGFLPARHPLADRVHDAMEFSLLAPGKRIRPILTLAVGEMYRAEPERLMPFAAAIEMVHTASLILDDLPSMDDSPLRRGRPSCHAQFGEATAILAAIGLLNRAFGVLAGEGTRDPARDRIRTLVARRVADAIGTDGVIGGQVADLELAAAVGQSEETPVDLDRLEFIHSRKTGSLFIVSAEIGGHLSGATMAEIEGLKAFAKNLGLAFQITDDLIDATGDADVAGKPVGADAGRPTFVTLSGVEGARTLAAELVETSVESLSAFGRRAGRLVTLARYVASRDR